MQEYQLVPKQMVGMLGQINQLQMSPNMDSMIKLDNEMDGILKNKNLTTDQKYALYQEALERYLIFRNKQTLQPQYQSIQHSGVKRNVESELIGVLPTVAAKTKATQLLNILKSKPDLLRWDDDGRIYYKNRDIKNSNIVDVIYDLVNSHSKNRNPKGIKEVQHALEELRVPDTFIVNTMRKSSNRNNVDSKATSTDTKSTATMTDTNETMLGTSSPIIKKKSPSSSPEWFSNTKNGRRSPKSSPRRSRSRIRRSKRGKSESGQRGDGISNIRFKPYVIPHNRWIPYI